MNEDEITKAFREDKQAAEMRKKALQEIFSAQPTKIGLEAEILELRDELERKRNEYNLFRYTAGAEIDRLNIENKSLREFNHRAIEEGRKQMQADNARMRAALEFYANRDNYIVVDFLVGSGSEISIDKGDIAREALEGGAE